MIASKQQVLDAEGINRGAFVFRRRPRSSSLTAPLLSPLSDIVRMMREGRTYSKSEVIAVTVQLKRL